MNLKSQVCSLEYAKRLKELNIKQESLFWWVEHESKNNINDFILASTYDFHQKNYYLDENKSVEKWKDGKPIEYGWRVNSCGCDCCSNDWKVINKYSAFTVIELSEMLPGQIEKNGRIYFLNITRLLNEEWAIKYAISHYVLKTELDKNLVDVMAQMLIWLLENGYVKK